MEEVAGGVTPPSQEITTLLQELSAACLPTAGVSGVYEAEQHIASIAEVVLRNLKPIDRDLCISKLLGEDYAQNLVTLYLRLIPHKEYLKPRVELSKFFKRYTDHIGRHLGRYAAPFQKFLFKCIRSDTSNTAKDYIFQTFDTLVMRRWVPENDENAQSPKSVIDCFYFELTTGRTKLSQTVRGHFFTSLGILASEHEDLFEELAPKLAMNFTKQLELERKNLEAGKAVQRQVIVGIFQGLTHFLDQFPSIIPTEPERSKSHSLQFIYEWTQFSTTNVGQQTRYNLCEAALALLRTHARLFKTFIFKDKRLARRLLDICTFHNRGVRLAGLSALRAITVQLSKLFVEHKDLPVAKRKFKELLDLFFPILEGKFSSAPRVVGSASSSQQGAEKDDNEASRGTSIAIRVFGQLAAPIRIFMSRGELAKLLKKMLEMSERTYTGSAEDIQNAVAQFPHFIGAFANILHELSEIELPVLGYLGNMILRLFKAFPELHEAHRRPNYRALTSLFMVLHEKGSVLRQLLETVVPMALRFSIMNLRQSVESVAQGALNSRDFVEYVIMWRHLLEWKDPRWDSEISFDESILIEMREVLYNELMGEILKLLQQLDLDYKPRDPANVGSRSTVPPPNDLSARYIAKSPVNFELFLNLVSFCTELLPTVKNDLFMSWASVLGREIIKLSDRYPLVSGFYKLMNMTFSICAKKGADFFDAEVDDTSMTDITDVSNADFASIIFKRYIRSVLTRMQHYTDELLFSCLQLVLNVPRAFADIKVLIGPLKLAFKVGIAQLDAAKLGMDALERWISDDFDAVTPHLEEILPCLSDFIRAPHHAGLVGVMEEGAAEVKEDPYAMPQRMRGSRSMASSSVSMYDGGYSFGAGSYSQNPSSFYDDEPSQRMRGAAGVAQAGSSGPVAAEKSAASATDPEKEEFVFRVLQFLGRIGGLNSMLITGKSKTDEDSVIMAWDRSKRVGYKWVLDRHSLDVSFDALLPRICELARASPDRRTKVAACETLHSIVVYMVLLHARNPNIDERKEEKQTPFHRLYARMFPTIMKLACDVEQVASSIFRRLMFQLIHWFTKSVKTESKETMALLDTVTDAVGDPEDAALREFAALCMAEFLKYSLKHFAPNEKDTVATNVKSLLRRLFSLAHHPNKFKRLGAALVFSQIYRQIREDRDTAKAYVLEMLRNMVLSLRLSETDDGDSSGAREEIRRVCDHFVKVVIDEEHGVFRDLNASQRSSRKRADIPVAAQSLPDFTTWIFEFCATSATDCRRQSLAIWESLAPKCMFKQHKNLIGSCEEWIKHKVSTEKLTYDYVRQIFEGSEIFTDGDQKNHLTPPVNLNDFTAVVSWLRHLGTSLDLYCWAFEREFLSPHDMFDSSHKAMFPSRLFSALERFFEFAEQADPFSEDLIGAVRIGKFRELKCIAARRAFRFVHLLLVKEKQAGNKKFAGFTRTYSLLTDSFSNIMFASILNPIAVGYPLKQIPFLQEQLFGLSATLSTFDNDKRRPVLKAMRRFFRSNEHLAFPKWNLDTFAKNTAMSSILLTGLLKLYNGGMLKYAFSEKTGAKVKAEELAKDVFSVCDRPNLPASLEIASQQLRLALRMGVEASVIINFMIDTTRVSVATASQADMDDDSDEDEDEERNTVETQGYIFYRHFHSVLDRHFVRNFEDFAESILQRIDDFSGAAKAASGGAQLFMILGNVLDHMMRARLRAEQQDHAAKEQRRQEQSQAPSSTLPTQSLYADDSQSLFARDHANGAHSIDMSSMRDDEGHIDVTQFIKKLLSQLTMKSIFAGDQTETKLRFELSLIEKLLVLDRDEVLDPNKDSFDFLIGSYVKCLGPKAPISVKRKAIEHLASFLEASNDAALNPVLQRIGVMVTEPPFPAQTRDLVQDSDTFKDYTVLLDALLEALASSRSFDLLEHLLPVFREKNHVHAAKIRRGVLALFRQLVQAGKQKECSEFCERSLGAFLDKELDDNPVDNARRWVCEDVLAPLLSCAHLTVVQGFYEKNQQKLFDIVKALPNGPTIAQDVDKRKIQLLELECAYKLLTVSYQRLGQSIQVSMNVPYKELVKVAHKHVQSCGVQGRVEAVSQLAFHAAAYNCLAAVITCTQTSPKFFDVILFNESPEKHQFLWSNIVDTEQPLRFTVDTNFEKSNKEIVECIRDNPDIKAIPTSGYLANKYLATSCLSQDASVMSEFLREGTSQIEDVEELYSFQPTSRRGGENDRHVTFSSSAAKGASSSSSSSHERKHDVRDDANAMIDEDEDEDEDDGSDDWKSADGSEAPDTLEMDTLNRSPTMQTQVDLITTMTKKFQAKWINSERMPPWMEHLHTKLTDSRTHSNIKWYICRLLILKAPTFKKFARVFFAPIIELAIADDPLKPGFHYFLRDICVFFLKGWADFVPEKTHFNRDICTKFIEKLLSVAADYGVKDGKTKKLANNLDLIRLLLHKWKGLVRVKKDSVVQLLFHDENDPTYKDRRAVGTRLLMALLSEGMPAHDGHVDMHIPPDKYFQSLLINLKSHLKGVYSGTAAVYVTILKNKRDKKTLGKPQYQKQFLAAVRGFYNTDTSKFIRVLNEIGTIYPEFFDRKVIQQVLQLLPRAHGEFESGALEVLKWKIGASGEQTQDAQEILQAIRMPIPVIVKNSYAPSLNLLLWILYKTINHWERAWSETQVKETLTLIISTCRSHADSSVRMSLFNILIHLYDNSDLVRKDESLFSMVKLELLRGMSDDQSVVKNRLYSFWERNMPTDVSARLVYLLKEMYHPDAEDHWLENATFLLVNRMKESSNFDEELSDQRLGDCEFVESYVDSEWHHRPSSMTPMFTQDPYATQREADLELRRFGAPLAMVRQTQKANWTPTLMTLTQQLSKLENPETRFDANFGKLAKSNLTFTQNTVQQVDENVFGGSFAAWKNRGSRKSAKQTGKTMSLRSRDSKPMGGFGIRFSQSDRSMRMKAHMYDLDKHKRFRDQWRSQRIRREANKVSLYRKYREGELPDVQIPHKDLLRPLQALHTDPELAKTLFGILFHSIYHKHLKRYSDAECLTRRGDIRSALESCLSRTKCNSFVAVSVMLLCLLECDDVQIAPIIIGNVSLSSMNLHAGVLLLEKMLGEDRSSEQPQRKRQRVARKSKSYIEQVYSQLARLYTELSEHDLVMGLYEKFSKNPDTCRAIQATMRGDVPEAQQIYEKLMRRMDEGFDWKEQEPTEQEKELWEDENLASYGRLCQWEELRDYVLFQVDRDAMKLWDENTIQNKRLQEVYVRYFIEASSTSRDFWETLHGFVDKSLLNNSHREYLENRFSSELAEVFANRLKVEQSNFYLRKSLQNFLNSWSELPLLADSARIELLQSLQSMAETQEFLAVAGKKRGADVADLVGSWKTRFPSDLDPVQVWDRTINTRRHYLDRLKEISPVDASSITDLTRDTYCRAADTLSKRWNFEVAAYYLNQANLLGETSRIKLVRFKKDFLEQTSEARMFGVEVDSATKASKLKDILDGVRAFERSIAGTDPLMQLDAQVLEGELWETLGNMVEGSSSASRACGNLGAPKLYQYAFDAYNENAQTFRKLVDSKKEQERELDPSMIDDEDDDETMVDGEHKHDEPSSSRASKRRKKGAAGSSMSSQLNARVADAFLKLGEFCSSRLEALEKSSDSKMDMSDDRNDYRKSYVDTTVKSILEAMQFNSAEARSRFPRALELCAAHPDVRPRFIAMTADIPSWQFLRWISQLLASLGYHEADCSIPILERIAKEYPQAIFYPFQLTREDLANTPASQKYIKRLQSHLNENRLLYAFIEALDLLTPPKMKFDDWNKATMQAKNFHKRDEVHKLYKTFYHDCISKTKTWTGNSYGKPMRNFAAKFANAFHQVFGTPDRCEKLLKMRKSEFRSAIQKILLVDTLLKKDIPAGKQALSPLSPWLAEFEIRSKEDSYAEQHLELPGQYKGLVRPDPDAHARIIGFDSTVLVMHSLRRPKRIGVRCNDEKEALLLVKGGEDLRLDQRIEQLFAVFNQVLKSNEKTRSRDIYLRTYDVVPLTRNVGVLEWLQNTLPIKALFENQLREHNRREQEQGGGRGAADRRRRSGRGGNDEEKELKISAIDAQYRQDIFKGQPGNPSFAQAFEKMHRTQKRSHVVKRFRDLESQLPNDLLLKGIKGLCASVESFIPIRSRFAKTFAAFAVCGYILGIGDRHLDNYLLDEGDGTLVGIDFGYSFGLGRSLPVPELVPMRLTRQFISLLSPLDTTVLLKHDMVHTLRALQESKNIILNVMNVFIKEPHLDFVKAAMRTQEKQKPARSSSAASQSSSSTENSQASVGSLAEKDENVQWYPKQKVHFARMKLERYKCSYIMTEELVETSHAKKPHGKYVMSYIQGDKDSLRRQAPDKCKSVEEQVDCLIEQSTDPNLLGRQWLGWQPFV